MHIMEHHKGIEIVGMSMDSDAGRSMAGGKANLNP